jgi:tRNA(Ile)-lysidine synthase
MFSPAKLLAALDARIARPLPVDFCVAYSGGLDSTVLLHAMAGLIAARPDYRLRAIHVDHQLHPDSARWAEHCEHTAGQLGVQFQRLTVVVSGAADVGLEAAARNARYDALRAALTDQEVLLTAHHADDQLETMLLALMRGSGVRGLGGMAPLQALGPGWLARPLLEFTRDELDAWARSERLSWIDDPSNQNAALDRNYLRHHVVPVLRSRWPAAAHTAARAAEHLAEAGQVLDATAEADAAAAAVDGCLSVAYLAGLDPARRRNVLRYWFRRCGARAPSTRKLAAIEHDMLFAADDRSPCIEWDGMEVRRHRGLLYCGPRQASLSAPGRIEWQAGECLELPAALGRLRMAPDAHGSIAASRLAYPLSVRFRSGGESLRPAGDAHHRSLKQLAQSRGILPWWRDRLPLVYSGDRLLAVGDLWVAEEFAARAAADAMRIVWEDRPPLIAIPSIPAVR